MWGRTQKDGTQSTTVTQRLSTHIILVYTTLTGTSAKNIVNTLTCYLSVVRLLLGYKLLQTGIQIKMSGKNVFLIILFLMITIIITMVVREVEEVERDMGRVAGLIGGAGAK